MSCSTIVNSRNDAFAIPQFTDQTSLSGTAIDAENAFVSSAFPGCSAGGNYGSSFAHVAVSVLTISSSTHVGQATPAPSAVPVAQSPTIPATKTASQLAKSPPSSKPAPPESTNDAPPQSENPVPPKSANPAPPQSANGASQSSSTVPPPSINAAPPQSVKSAPPQSTNAASPQTTNAAPTRSSNAAPPQTSNATPPQSATHIVIGGTTSVLSPPPALSPPSAPVITVNSQPVQANSAGQYTADGQTLAAGSPTIVTGQAISLAPSGNAITPISLAPSASQIAIGTSTIKLSSSATSSGGFGGVIMGGFSSAGTVATRSGLVTGGVITPTGVAGITGTTGAGTSAMAFTGGASGRFGAGRGVWGALVMVVVWWYLG